MTYLLIPILVLTGLIFSPVTSFAKKSSLCDRRYTKPVDSNPILDELWRHSSGSILMSLRAGAHHYWSWASQRSAQVKVTPIQALLLSSTGVVAADLHQWNFSDIWVGGEGQLESRYLMNDYDDGGVGSVFYDFLNLYNKTVILVEDISNSEKMKIMNAYIKGLDGQKNSKPHSIKKALDSSEKKIWSLHEEMIGKLIRGDKLILGDSKELKSIEDSPQSLQRRFEENKSQFNALISTSGYEILDTAVRVKSAGGSQGIPVFWYLVKNRKSGKKEIIEFKQQPEKTAIAEYMEQPNHKDRLNMLFNSFWTEKLGAQKLKLQYSHFLGKDTYYYLVRPRFPKFIDVPEVIKSKEDRDEFLKMSIYDAHYTGRRHGEQKAAAEYSNAILKNKVDFFELVESESSVYIGLAINTQCKLDENLN